MRTSKAWQDPGEDRVDPISWVRAVGSHGLLTGSHEIEVHLLKMTGSILD